MSTFHLQLVLDFFHPKPTWERTEAALAGVVGWQTAHPPEMVYVRALGAIDQTLIQQWGSLPKATQEQLATTYARVGMSSPGERKGR
jgi:hypothetical protein